MAIYMAAYMVVAYAWNCSLIALGHPLTYRRALDILAISQFAKYLPGNIGHHVGRVMLARQAGLPTDVILASMFFDTLFVVVAAGFWSIFALKLLAGVIQSHGEALTQNAAALALAGLAFGALLALFIFLPKTRSRMQQLYRLRKLHLPFLLRALTAHGFSFVLSGTALYILCVAFAHNALTSFWPTVVSVFAGAWLLGFLIPGAPAGLGVREVALLLGLGPLFGTEVATATAASLRLVTTAGDGLVFAAALALKSKRPFQRR